VNCRILFGVFRTEIRNWRIIFGAIRTQTGNSGRCSFCAAASFFFGVWLGGAMTEFVVNCRLLIMEYDGFADL
jgi:hypothetical protein